MRKALLALLLLAFVAVPTTAVADGAAPAAEPEVTVAELQPADAPLFADQDCQPQMSTGLDLETPTPQPQSTLCSTTCSTGGSVSCPGPPCIVEPHCFVYCGVRVFRCPICP
ncbi:MAG TPA: hypothetical protein VKU40_15575 [Thermoanaerobaculia bacterium]|nr:hypothetical protein [Thermoanaerobaculia bacterium]